MDIKVLDEEDTRPHKTPRKRWIIFLLLAAAIVAGSCILYYTHDQNKSTTTHIFQSSDAQISSALQSST